ncbi:ABC transporter ATP-binding protein [Streptomyces sp. ST2-7A]|uniref:ABC transporter ATP-binding protein n=1 Tax=Streptomyces sp. ST2-7A TaxID=2907214 RepID=UPI001F348D6B|nr:ABC transporter ATP-binding protein [Streptomyces sp. ST2-7A]MCE7082458.1 ABC transporter ATP-binding protein/permease [Streptomyces sp. ST2-7A]
MSDESTDAPADKALHFRASALRLLREMRADRFLLIATVLSGVVTIALTMSLPLLLGRVTDIIVDGARSDGVDFDRVARSLWVVGVLVLCAVFFAVIRGRLTARISQRVAYRLREKSATKLTRLPLSHFDRQPRGEILSRITNDVDNISQTLQHALGGLVAAVLTIIGALAMMLVLSPVLTLVALVTVPVAGLVAKKIAKRAQPHFVDQWAATGTLSAHVEEMYSGHAVVTTHGRQAEAISTFEDHNEKVYRSSAKAQFLSGAIEPAMAFIGHLNYVLIAVIGGLRVASGTMTIGEVQAFIGYTLQFNNPITQVAAYANLMQSGVASAERVFQLIDSEEERPDAASPIRPDKVRGQVTFDQVSFRYEPDKPLIEGLSLTVQPGETVAIVGPTGAGKTTLVNLLMRFYEPTAGRIGLDGTDISRMSRAELRGNIGMVLQDTWLFSGTIAENIAYGDRGADRDRVVRAAREAYADRFIRTLPDGYDTVLEDDGTNLSAGEKQLVTIARAFLTRPAIMVLDEATSSVDTRTELLVQQAMASLRADRTSFVIAHRLSTIRDADTILVMDAGSIVEQGSHARLMAAGGVYARLYESQFAPQADNAVAP